MLKISGKCFIILATEQVIDTLIYRQLHLEIPNQQG